MLDRRRLIIILSLVVLTVAVFASILLPPPGFPTDVVVEIPVGSSTGQIADLLYEHKIIRSARIFELLVLRQKLAERLRAGFYQFEKPLTLHQVVRRLKEGLFADELVKLTVPEGFSVEQLADLAVANFPQIQKNAVMAAASSSVGFLFPDTYLLPPSLTAEQLVTVMRENFDRQTAELKITNDAVIMASLVEEETKTKTDRRIVAGILWKRLDAKMRLEVDVATSTYDVLGLPPAPIVSPGLESLEAALAPQATPYWFYLSDKQGKMHYAKTFAEHQKNIAIYLK